MRFNNIEFNNKSGAYLRTTENINGYYDNLSFAEKKVLTIIGSGDHIFEAVLRGAKDIEGFDISTNAILMYYLKEAAIKSISFEEYLGFFFVENTCFTRETYQKIRDNINEVAKPFWDKVFSSKEIEPLESISNILVSKPALYMTPQAASMKMSPLSSYLSEENYYKLQSMINNSKISINLRDVKEVEKVSSNYDYIILSNVFEYQDSDAFLELIAEYRKHLNPDGLIVVGYAYHDVDLTIFSEFDKLDIPSRYTLNGISNAPVDHIITTGYKK